MDLPDNFHSSSHAAICSFLYLPAYLFLTKINRSIIIGQMGLLGWVQIGPRVLSCKLKTAGKFVEIPTLNLKGYLFEENYIPRFKIENFDGRFTPDIFDIQVCEELLSHFDTLNRKRSKKLRRQYLGLTRSNSMFILS
ncbi:MAG: hypothetical protein IPN72_06920 [Saprospiraceae bacterium]|nr:hypothetical protein [Saprospiraceae bacterium]